MAGDDNVFSLGQIGGRVGVALQGVLEEQKGEKMLFSLGQERSAHLSGGETQPHPMSVQ